MTVVCKVVGLLAGSRKEDEVAAQCSSRTASKPPKLYFRSRLSALRQGSLEDRTISHMPSLPRLPTSPGSPMLESHCITHSQILLVTTF